MQHTGYDRHSTVNTVSERRLMYRLCTGFLLLVGDDAAYERRVRVTQDRHQFAQRFLQSTRDQHTCAILGLTGIISQCYHTESSKFKRLRSHCRTKFP